MTATYQELADRLESAYRAGPISPLRDGLDATDARAAYAVQAINTHRWQSRGRQIVGRKIGLTAKAVQEQLGVAQPDFGVLFSDMQIEDEGALFASQVLQPKAEAEVALILAADIRNVAATVDDVANATAYAVPAIEIVDSRIADWKITFADTVADNGSSAFFVLGNDKRPLPGLDLYSCGMVLQINGQVASVGAGAACFGHPLEAAAWLARTLASEGESLRAGDIVLTGALGPMVKIAPGDHVRALIGGLGSCQFSFNDEQQ